MASRFAPRRPPDGFVPITPGRWSVFCELLEEDPSAREIIAGGRRIGWRAPRLWYVDPEGYREVAGAWPPGYWPYG
jgi:hypothetical protein